mmetsp:Transcript_20477/g.47389  ORF Transcript_20477/g.47389 Transcript_20477/m.47389 type:complete len:82 (+) Transcript_20477:573-818(+)
MLKSTGMRNGNVCVISIMTQIGFTFISLPDTRGSKTCYKTRFCGASQQIPPSLVAPDVLLANTSRTALAPTQMPKLAPRSN